jgi:hypothetical protein
MRASSDAPALLEGIMMTMETNRNFTHTSQFVIAEPKSRSSREDRQRVFWISVIGVCGIAGLASGITGLTLSLLTAVGAIERTRSMSIAVSILIVASLGLLLMAAHAMDRTDSVK